MQDEIQVLPATNTDVIYQQDKAVVDMQIATAKAYPRNIKRAVDNAIAIVTMDKQTAQSCHYALPRGGKSISGPSVHLAKILAQNWGNLRVAAKVIDIGKTQITSHAIAFDLENNVSFAIEVKRSIMTKSGRMNDDMITVTGNAANAIALRNAIFAAIPKNVTEKVYNAALEVITGDLSDETKFISQRKKMIEWFYTQYKVEEKEVLEVLGKQDVNNVTKQDLVTLHGIAQAIKDGDTTAEETFRPKKQAKTEIKDPKAAQEERASKMIDEADSPEDLQKIKEIVDQSTNQELKTKFTTKLSILQ